MRGEDYRDYRVTIATDRQSRGTVPRLCHAPTQPSAMRCARHLDHASFMM